MKASEGAIAGPDAMAEDGRFPALWDDVMTGIRVAVDAPAAGVFSVEGPSGALAAEISLRAAGHSAGGQGFRNTIAKPSTTTEAKNKREYIRTISPVR
jgi:hypothetical protein